MIVEHCDPERVSQVASRGTDWGVSVMLRAILAVCILCFCAGCDQAQSKRLALVIGNSAYRNISPLANPENDARLVAKALAASGFDVRLAADLDRKGMEAALQEFSLDAMQADVAMVYFAGHGLEANGANWLVPIDASIGSFDDVPAAAVPFEMVAGSVAGASVKILALDACRDNPFAARLQSASGAINRGLAEVELDGYVIIYAAAAGQVALDGDANSPFAQSFARWVGEQNVDLRLLAGKIRDDVIATTSGKQRPFVSASLSGQVISLAPAGAGKVGPAASVRQRTPYYFDYVRTLRDKACVPTREIKCQTEAMTEAAGQFVTIEDDAKLRIWDTASEAAARTESVSVRGFGPRDVTFLASASALAVTIDGNITMVPLSGGAPQTHKVEHGNYPEFLFAAGTPALAVYAYRSQCGFGGVDLGSFTLAGKTTWAPACMSAEIAWSLPDPASDRFVALVTTAIKKEPHGGKELLLASYRSREVICRIDGGVNDAAFSADGDLYTAHDDGTIVRHDKNCLAK